MFIVDLTIKTHGAMSMSGAHLNVELLWTSHAEWLIYSMNVKNCRRHSYKYSSRFLTILLCLLQQCHQLWYGSKLLSVCRTCTLHKNSAPAENRCDGTMAPRAADKPLTFEGSPQRRRGYSDILAAWHLTLSSSPLAFNRFRNFRCCDSGFFTDRWMNAGLWRNESNEQAVHG